MNACLLCASAVNPLGEYVEAEHTFTIKQKRLAPFSNFILLFFIFPL